MVPNRASAIPTPAEDEIFPGHFQRLVRAIDAEGDAAHQAERELTRCRTAEIDYDQKESGERIDAEMRTEHSGRSGRLTE